MKLRVSVRTSINKKKRSVWPFMTNFGRTGTIYLKTRPVAPEIYTVDSRYLEFQGIL